MDDYTQGYNAGFAAGYLQGSQATRISIDRGTDVPPVAKRSNTTKKRKGTPLKGMSAALKKANARAKLKSGKFRKGWNQRRLMQYAHKIRKG